MAVQDLTNTSWKWNGASPEFSGATYNGTTKSITFLSNNETFSGMTFASWHGGDINSVAYNGTNDVYVIFSDIDGGTYESIPKYLHFQITGGSDVQDSQLIAWIEANATQETVSRVEIDLSTLSGWSDVLPGSHTLTIKALAVDYRDSDFSTPVSIHKKHDPLDPPEKIEVEVSGAGTYVGVKASFVDEAEQYEYFIDGTSVGTANKSFLIGAIPIGTSGSGSSCTVYGKINSDTVSPTDYTWKVDSNGNWSSQYNPMEQVPDVSKIAFMSSINEGNIMAMGMSGDASVRQSTTPVVVKVHNEGFYGLVYHFTG